MPVTVKQILHLWVLKDGADSILRQAHGVVLHRLVLPVQTDGDLEDILITAWSNYITFMMFYVINEFKLISKIELLKKIFSFSYVLIMDSLIHTCGMPYLS